MGGSGGGFCAKAFLDVLPNQARIRSLASKAAKKGCGGRLLNIEGWGGQMEVFDWVAGDVFAWWTVQWRGEEDLMQRGRDMRWKHGSRQMRTKVTRHGVGLGGIDLMLAPCKADVHITVHGIFRHGALDVLTGAYFVRRVQCWWHQTGLSCD